VAASQRAAEAVHTDEEQEAGAGAAAGEGADEAEDDGGQQQGDGEDGDDAAGEAPAPSQSSARRVQLTAVQLRERLETLKAQEELDEFMRKKQENKRTQAQRAKKQTLLRRGRRAEEDEDEEEEAEEAEEEAERAPKKKARKSLTLEETMAAAMAPPTVKQGAAAKTVADMEAMLNTYFIPNRWRTARAEAEARRLWFVMWQIASMIELTAPAAASAGRAVAIANPVLTVTEAMIKGLMAYDLAPSGAGGAATQTKVRELEQTIAAAASAMPMHGMKAREVLPVPSAFLHGAANGAAAAAAPYQKSAWAKKREDEAAAAAGPAAELARLEKQLEVMTAANVMLQQQQQRQPFQQQAYNPAAAAAQQQMGQQIPFQQQQQQQMGYGGYGPRGPLRCHRCQMEGHIAVRCPNPIAVSNQQAAAGPPAVSTQHAQQYAQMQYELAPEWQQQYSPEWQEQYAPEWQQAQSEAAAGWQMGEEADTEMVGMGVGVGWMSRQRSEQLSSASTSHIFNIGQRASKAGTGRLPAQPTCSCGSCGACTQGIDLLHKEQRENKRVAKQPLAQKLEAALERVPEAPSKIIQIAEELQIWAEERLNGWRLEQGAEEEDVRDAGREAAEGRGAPPKAMLPIGKLVGPGNKRHFDRMSLGPCQFCKRKGHNKETCMAMPVFNPVEPESQRTELQRRKIAFVEGLLARGTRPAEDRAMREGESRLDAAKRAMAVGAAANEGNPWAASGKRRDRLRRRLGYWWAIGADRVVISWIGYGVELKFERQPTRLYFANHRSYAEHEEHVEKEHVQHLADGSYEEADASEVQIGNPLQVEVNEKDKARTCQDARYVNAYIADYAFTQETLSKHVAMILERDMQMITTDVEKAYYQVPLHKRSQPYLAWRHRGKWIKPTIIVFGIKPAPFVFTKMMRVLLIFIRMLGVRGSNCIDDNLWADMHMADVVELVQLVFGETGWTFNSKCVFKPSMLALYNGMWLDTKRFEIRAVDEKIDAARRVAWTIWYAARDGEQVMVRDLQKLTGRLQSMKLAIEGVAV